MSAIFRKIIPLLATGVMISSYAKHCGAEIRFTSDWYGSLSIPASEWEESKLRYALEAASLPLNAVSNSTKGDKYKATPGLPFKLHFGAEKYYLQPALFVARNQPNEICTPTYSENRKRLECTEGQRYKESCHLMFFNAKFENVGVYRFYPDEPFEAFCNGVVAVGIADKARDEIFATFQYFSIDKPLARSASELGSGWKRVTLLLHLSESEGRISVREDLSCIPKPNALETIPDARVALKACRSKVPPQPS